MIAPTIIREIECLLEEGQHSHRQVAEITGVCRSTVAAVAKRERQTDDYLDTLAPTEPLGETRICPECGGIVQMPCKLCQTRELMISKRLRRPKPIVDTPIGLDLKPEHQARYAEVRRWRREARRIGMIVPVESVPDGPPTNLPAAY